MGFLLFIIASVLKWVIAPLSYTYGIFRALFVKEFDNYNYNLAIAKDQYGNALCKYLFNDFLIKKEGYKFGNIDETISSCIGKNRKKKTLSAIGKVIDFILDIVDDNHSIESIDETIK